MLDEVHALMQGNLKHEPMDITDAQFDQYWTTIDVDHNDQCELQEVTAVIITYDIWRFEKVRKEEIEEIFDTNPHCMRSRVLCFVSTPNYEMISNLSTIFNVCMIYVAIITR